MGKTPKEPLDSTSVTKSRKKKHASSASGATGDAGADADQFAEAKELLDSFAPKMREFGMPIDDIQQKLLDEVLAKLTQPIEKMLQTLSEGMSAGGSASKAVSSLSNTLKSSLTSFSTAVPFTKLLQDLPKKLMELVNLIMAAVHNPSVLLPSFKCGSGRGGSLEETAGAITKSFLGSKQRETLWTAFSAKFEKIVQPLNEALPQLRELPEIFTSMEKSFKNVDNAVKSVSSLSSVQGDCEKLLKDLLASIKAPAPKGQSLDVMSRLENAVTQAKSVDGFGATLAKAAKTFSKALNHVYEFFRSLEHLVMKVASVSWNSLFQSMAALHAHYPSALADAKKIMKASGVLAPFLQPSAYLTKIEDSVKDLQALVDLDAAAKSTKAAANGLMAVLQLPTDSTSTPAGPAQKEMSTFSVKTLDPIREQFDSVLSLTKVQDLVLSNATSSIGGVLQGDILGMVQKYVDTFSAAAAKKLADAALEQANKMKDAMLAECEELKNKALAAAETMKAEILNKANEAKAAVEAQIGELKTKMASMQAEVQQMASDAKANAEKLVADAKLQAQQQVDALQAKAAKLRADAELEVSAMKQKILDEAAQQKAAIVASANATKEQLLGDARKQAQELRSAAQAEISQLRTTAQNEVSKMKADMLSEARGEIDALKKEALGSLKSGASDAAKGGAESLFKSFF